MSNSGAADNQDLAMRDVLYFGHEGRDEYAAAIGMARELPDAAIEDASDDIHGWRFSVRHSMLERHYYAWLRERSLERHSLSWRIDDLTAEMDNFPGLR